MVGNKKEEYDHFFEWFHENEGFALRSERFYDDLTQFVRVSPEPMKIVEWLSAAFEAGKAKKY